MKPDRHSTSLAKTPSVTQAIETQGDKENNARKKSQTVPWDFLQKAEGVLDPIRLPSTSTSKETLIQEDETSDHDQSLTLLVDDDDYKQEKEVVEVKSFLIPIF